MGIKPGNFNSELAEYLSNYTDEVTEGIFKGVEVVANETNEEIKKRIPFNEITGKYIKAFKIKESYRDKRNRRMTWHVAKGQHRLTHLLEYGHIKVNGGRVKAYPHIRYGEELAKKRMIEIVEKAVKK